MADPTLTDYSPDIGDNTTYYVLVPRTDDEGDTLAEYLRLGAASDDADWSTSTTMEEHAVERFNSASILTQLDDEVGADGTLVYTSGDALDVVEGNSYRRVLGTEYGVYGKLHQIYEDVGIASGYTEGILGHGIDYTMSRATQFTASLAADLNFTGGFQYDATMTAALSSTTGVGMNLNLGSAVEVTHALKAEFDAKGGFDYPSSGLNHSEKPVYFGEESITMGLDDDPIRGFVKNALGTLAGLMQATDIAYNANGTIAAASIELFNRRPTAIEDHVDAGQIIAVTQGTLALIASIVCLMAGRIQSKKAKALALNIDGKPFVRVEKGGGGTPNKITLDSGAGAKILLEGDKITLDAAEVQIGTNAAANARKIKIASGAELDLQSGGNMGIVSGGTTTLTSTNGDVTINAGAKNIKSTAAKWKQTGEFEAGKTKLGDVTATSIKLNGVPVATTANVTAVQQSLKNDIQTGDLAAIAQAKAWAAELAELVGGGVPSIPGT